MRELFVIDGSKFRVVAYAGHRGDVKSPTQVFRAAITEDVISFGFSGLIDLRVETNIADEFC